ncbi:hypothetical protein Pcinc_000012 [Petrolisthes cinctipes]|uniref:PiggyBac transposable element-derived protein 4 C-terminal zinc-ribbon domain-containing protein n=1 Tax=Petrolisthes cinctipes TaxID=88211 RepID=A0AAE1GSH7_PETCI|nr:hypothetical protein Pcinc_000012 [Petrolisthes cinctipes]
MSTNCASVFGSIRPMSTFCGIVVWRRVSSNHGLKRGLVFLAKHTKTQQVIKSVFPEVKPPAKIPINLPQRKRCWLYHTKKDRKTGTPCITCKKPVCLEHSSALCMECV